MIKALVIARREVAEKKFVFLTALAAAILPFLTALVPTMRHWSPKGIVSLSASIFATGLALGLAVIGGASMIGRELSERRLSFYFARPVGGMSIWFGKLGAALFILLSALTIVLVPALLFAGDEWRTFGGGQWEMIGWIVIVSVVLLCVAHLFSTFVRSRSVLVVLDFVLAVGVAFAIPMMIRPLWNGMATHTITGLSVALVIAFVLAVVIGGAWQVADGRTDRKRSHAALSRAFWSVMGVALLAGALYVTWVVSAKPSDLGMQLDVHPAQAGNWIFLNGQAPHRSDFLSGFMYDLESGRYIRVSGNDILWSGAGFTHDGKAGIIRQRYGGVRDGNSELVLVPVAENAPRSETGLITRWNSPLVVSDDARRAAYLENGTFTVYDIPSKRSLASVRAGVQEPLSMYFPSPDVVRIFSMGKTAEQVTVVISELDVKTKSVRKTGELTAAATGGFVSASADGSKMLLRAYTKGDLSPESLIVADAHTGQRLMAVPRVEGSRVTGAALLADGTLFVPTVRDGRLTARVFGSDGALLREIPLGGGDHAFVAAELTGNRIVLGTTASMPGRGSSEIYVIDVARGQILRRTDALGIYGFGIERDPRRGAPSDRLLAAMTKEALVSWDPLSGAIKRIATRAPEEISRVDLYRK